MRVQDEKSGKSRLNLHDTKQHFGGKINWLKPKKKEIKRRAHGFEDPRWKPGFKEGVQLKDSICFK
jgi:hypothetical protein